MATKAKKRPTFKGFTAWLAKQPPSKEYVWGDGSKCAIAQYLESIKYPKNADEIPFGLYVRLEGGDKRVAMSLPHTFGAALSRARASAPRT